MGVAVSIQVHDEQLQARLRQLSTIHLDDLLDHVGAVVESQTQTRIQSDKTDPMGAAWEAWSEKYAATRHGNDSLLMSSGKKKKRGGGHLRDSITHEVKFGSEAEVEVGTNVVYGPAHQYGRPEINLPKRPYLGVGPEDEREIEHAIDSFMDRFLGGR